MHQLHYNDNIEVTENDLESDEVQLVVIPVKKKQSSYILRALALLFN